MLVSMVPTVQILGFGQCKTYCSLMSPLSLSFPDQWELQCGEAQRDLTPGLLLPRVISDGLGCNIIHDIPYCA